MNKVLLVPLLERVWFQIEKNYKYIGFLYYDLDEVIKKVGANHLWRDCETQAKAMQLPKK